MALKLREREGARIVVFERPTGTLSNTPTYTYTYTEGKVDWLCDTSSAFWVTDCVMNWLVIVCILADDYYLYAYWH